MVFARTDFVNVHDINWPSSRRLEDCFTAIDKLYDAGKIFLAP
jgi:hypothetical protein